MTLAETQKEQRDAFVERLLQSTSGVFDIFSIYIGDRLGYYQALVDDCPLTSGELAARTNTQERYAREWLEQQTVAGILYVENPDDDANERRFCLPTAYGEQLAPWFADVAVRRYENELQVTEAAPLIAYVRTRNKLDEGQMAACAEYVEAEIARRGAIRLAKEAGLFVPRADRLPYPFISSFHSSS